jgi:hypothetical protein
MDDRMSGHENRNNSTNRRPRSRLKAPALGKEPAPAGKEGRLILAADKALVRAGPPAGAARCAEETPDVRAGRVEQLHDQVQSGNYEVPIEALAKRLLSRLKDL